jgi:TonB family protein
MEKLSAQDTRQVQTASTDPSLHAERAATLIRLATLEQKAGRIAEAERLFIEAIEVGDEHLGDDHSSQGVALNELSRLLVRRGDHARAEPVLERLRDIALEKGARHPDVATALAGLAVTKRGLGDDAAAEQLYRQALAIREEALPPNHMAIVITMEQLSETCAARGNYSEALSLMQRAVPRRECALGAEHPTVIAGRDRKVELARKMFESRLADLRKTAVPMTGAVVPLGAVLMEPAAKAPAPIAPREIEVAHVAVREPELMSRELERVSEVEEMLPTRKRHKARMAAVSGSVVVALMAIAGFTLGSRNDTVSGNVPTVTSSEERMSLVSSASDASARTWERASGARAGLPATTNTVATEAPTAEASAPALPSMRRVVVPKIALPNPDEAIQIRANVARDAEMVSTGVAPLLTTTARGEETSVIPPSLIGTAPTPHFPDELRARRVEGEVVVRFKVDEKGRVDVSSMQVVRSAHDLFTAAVRNSLSGFRFEPARSTARDAKPEAAWVQFRTEFTAQH